MEKVLRSFRRIADHLGFFRSNSFNYTLRNALARGVLFLATVLVFPNDLFQKKPADIRVHFLGICGVAMGPLAIELQRLGYQVSGSDDQSHPPISLLLESKNIAIEPFDSEKTFHVDLVVVGRAATSDSPLPASLISSRVPVLSYPDLIAHFINGATQRVAVVGTKGKTTTTAMLAWIAECAGLSPDFLIGGIPGNFPSGIRLAGSRLAILEGDEYASSPTDLTPKFLRYEPTSVVLTNIHPDHEDLYPNYADYEALFSQLLGVLHAPGFAVICGDVSSNTQRAIDVASVSVATVGWENTNQYRITNYQLDTNATRFTFFGQSFHLPLLGKANVLDAALATVAAHRLGIAPAISADALRTFSPVQERLQPAGLPGGRHLFIESSAHPASLRIALEALRENHLAGSLLCVVQPQFPGSSDGYVQRHLPEALASATHVVVAPPASPIDIDPPFSCERLVADLTERGVTAAYRRRRSEIVSWVREHSAPGDTILLAAHTPSRTLLLDEITRALQ